MNSDEQEGTTEWIASTLRWSGSGLFQDASFHHTCPRGHLWMVEILKSNYVYKPFFRWQAKTLRVTGRTSFEIRISLPDDLPYNSTSTDAVRDALDTIDAHRISIESTPTVNNTTS